MDGKYYFCSIVNLILRFKMIRFLIPCLFLMSLNPVRAQSQDQQAQLDLLTLKVDSLSHELLYLRLSHELSVINANITVAANGVQINTITVEGAIASGVFDKDYGNMLQQLYYSALYHKNALIYNRDTQRDGFVKLMTAQQFTETELTCLRSAFDAIEASFQHLDAVLELFKLKVDIYRLRM